MNMYSDYFKIDEGYWPEINSHSIKDPANKWEKTFPHETVIALMKAMERMLARAHNNEKKGIWAEGAYGTGKSRVMWMLKNLLDCSAEELEAYFDEYPALQAEVDLKDKLLGHKHEQEKGKIVTAYRYASSSIDGDRALILAVYESITKALREANVPYKGENTLRGSVATWISNDENKAYFSSLIVLPEYRGLGSFAGKSADDIIKLLKNSKYDAESLMRDIFTLADSRDIRALSINMDELIEWITDVIGQNSLKAIVLVWDEFSAYFKKNKTSLDEFQKLSELSNLKPFYMIIVTHMSGSIFSEGDQAGKIVRDRFIRKEIELPDPVAFELIQHALKIIDVHEETWEELADDLNSRMPNVREAVRRLVWKDSNKGDDVLRGMLPLHPLAALLLKYISEQFASNQRSMFNFIKNPDSDNLQAFQWFIQNHSPDESAILTVDYLWNFFYEKGTDDNTTLEGKSNFDSIIRTVLDTYPQNEDRLFDEDKRVLKTVLMMQAISQKLGDRVSLFVPTVQNIDYAFEGTEFEDNRAVTIANTLVKNGILYLKPMGGGKTQYAAAAVSGDQAQIDIIKKEFNRDTKTMSLITSGELITALSLSAALRLRYAVEAATVDNFTSIINKITNETTTHKIRAVITFAKNDEEQNKIRKFVKDVMLEERYSNLVFIDTSTTMFSADRFKQWVECAANEKYWRPKDPKLADEMSRKAKEILEDWKTDISNGSFKVYSVFNANGELCGSETAAAQALSNIVLKKYNNLTFDNAKVTDNVFLQTQLPSSAKNGIMQSHGGVFSAKDVEHLLQGAWKIDNYWECSPTIPISKLKVKVDNFLQEAFDRDKRISIGIIFDYLMDSGFMPCNLYSLLTGFLLKEYATETYRYSVDGETGEKMTPDKLSEFIGEYIKHKNSAIPRYKEKFIEVMTKEHIAFVSLANTVFGIPENLSVDQIASRIRAKIKDIGFPIWCFKEIDMNGLDDFIDKLAELANSGEGGESIHKIAEKIGKASMQTPTAAGNLATLLTKPNAPDAMREFLEIFDGGELLVLAKDIGVQDVLLDVKRLFTSGTSREGLWLWDKETGEEELRKLMTDYRIVSESNNINGKASSLQACLKEWQEKLKALRIPYASLCVELSALKGLLSVLRNIATTGDVAYDKRLNFLSALKTNGRTFVEFFASKITVFQKIYSVYLVDFSETEVSSLFSKLPMHSFTMDKPEYEKELAKLAERAKGEQEKHTLLKLWREKTGSKTPREWSSTHKTPILSLISTSIRDDARRIFGILNRSNPEPQEVKVALEFLQRNIASLDVLSDKAQIDVAFVRDIIGKYIVLLPDCAAVREHLDAVVTTHPYDWYGEPQITREVEKYAQSKYNQGGSDKVVYEIENMPTDKLKQWLRQLVIDNMNIGIEIIAEGELKS